MYKRLLALFSLTAVAVGVALTGYDGDDAAHKILAFTAVSTPVTDAEKRLLNSSPKIELNGKRYDIAYNTIMRSGDKVGTGVFGQLYDIAGNIIKNTDGSPFISNANDHSSLLDVYGKLFMVSQFEDRVGMNYVTELKQDAVTGKLIPISTKPVDNSGISGTWVHCAGSRTPWKTHLGSEEYEPNAADPNLNDNSYYKGLAPYFGGDITKANPYNYGFITEATITGANMGTGTFASNVKYVKHYSMGRMAFELAYVMPDQKTAYMTDDGSYVGLLRFEAEKAGDLGSGKLYAAKVTQKDAANGGSFDLSWVDLGAANDAEIKTFIDSKKTFADIFDKGNVANCPADYKLIVTSPGAECLKVKTGMEKIASRLETRRYAAMLGATTEFNKEEGITFDAESNRLFVAMSFIDDGMLDNDSTKKENAKAVNFNHIRIPKNACGTVYALDLDANYVAKNMYGLVSGKPATYPAGDQYAGNTCDVNNIANPDNITFFPGYSTLVIGEDTGTGHQNDAIWSYNLNSKALTRIFTTPYGSETTSPYVYQNIYGWGYMMGVVQHPYGESDTDKAVIGSPERRAYTGYFGPFPKLD